MRNYAILSFGLILILSACKTTEQKKSNGKKDETIYVVSAYESAYTRRADLINTKLFLTPLWKKREMKGKAEITFKQHFYPSDSVTFNARGMTINSVTLVNGNDRISLKYNYDSLLLTIRLPRTYLSEEIITVSIDYISNPESLDIGGSSAINSDKGLYFVDVDSVDESRPTQLWTQGETQSNSVWFPTIESPEQKTTTEIFITTDSAFKTLSNGLLLETINNNNGTFTWHWKQDFPAAPYLVMIAVGDFAIIKDKWNGIEVSYYVDPAYEKYARQTFGKTPEMMTFFSKLLGITYPWQKYSQIVVHDFVSGAMENVTAVVHGTNMHQDPGTYIDDNYEHYISHELFHHWFGNMVTCRSWSNVTLNEGFANYAEYLWMEYKYGKTVAESHLVEELRIYLRSTDKSDPALIRYQFEDREDMYDRVSYNKGGCVLHMLRNYLGDSAFFKGCNLYLTQNKFSSAEADNLRHAFEKVSGEDLNWFFNQWYYRGGHPILNVSYKWNNALKKEIITIKQVQDLNTNPLYKLPLDIDFYFENSIERKKIIVTKNIQEFEFSFDEKPKVVSVDAERVLVGAVITDRPEEETIYLYDHSTHVRDRSQAVTTFGFVSDDNSQKSQMIRRALKDPAEVVRKEAIIYASIIFQNNPESIKELLFDVALHDSSTEIRSTALQRMKTYYKAEECMPVFEKCLTDKSHRVVATAFGELNDKDPVRGAEVAVQLESDSSSQVLTKLATYYADNDTTDLIRIYKKAFRYGDRWDKYSVLEDVAKYGGSHYNLKVIKASIDLIANEARGSAFDHYKTISIEVLSEVREKLLNSSLSFSKNESRWLKYNKGMTKDEITLELADFQLYIEGKQTAITNDK